ncbi:unnamed protein product, partial [Ectocarpus fasciculatus]
SASLLLPLSSSLFVEHKEPFVSPHLLSTRRDLLCRADACSSPATSLGFWNNSAAVRAATLEKSRQRAKAAHAAAMSAAVWDAENGGAPATAAVAAAAAESSAENWEPASQAGISGGVGSAGGSGYPETKDNGEDAAANLFGNDIPDQQDGETAGGPAVVIASIAPAGGGGLGTRDSAAGTAFASGTSTLTKRRNSMAFEIARVERAGKAALANPEKGRRVWELSRPRFVEESSVHGPGMGGSGS